VAKRSSEIDEPQWFGDYELSRLLGTGGMAEVYEARRHGAHGFSKRFALKRMLPELSRDPRLVQMFCDEARVQASLTHSNLVQVVEFGEVSGELYMVLEFIDGFSCDELLSALAARHCRLDLAPALYVTREVLRALCYVHDAVSDSGKPLGLVHGDVAPGNILVAKTGEVKLADFGITQSGAVPASSGDIRGKVGYISPEQALGGALDARSDLFSLSVVLAEMLIGRPLFPGSSEGEVLASLHAHNLERLRPLEEIQEDARAVLLRGLAHVKVLRYASAREYLNDVDRVIARHELGFDSHDLSAWLSDRGLVAIQSHVRVVRNAGRDADTLPDWRGAPALGALRVPEASPTAQRDLDRELANPRSEPPQARVEYRLRRASGSVSGPLGLAKMLELIATAKILGDTSVCRNAGPFLALNSVHELARLGSRPAYRLGDFIGLRATSRGPLLRATLPRFLFELMLTRRTGLLCARAGREQLRIYVVEGAPSFSTSTSPEHLLGERLLRAGTLDRAALTSALESGFRKGQRLGEALIERGTLTPAALAAELSLQCCSRLGTLLGFADGELLFVDGERSGEDEAVRVRAPLSVLAELVLRSYSRDEARALLRGTEQSYLVRTPNADRSIRALDLKGEEAEALERLQPTEELPSLLWRLHTEAALDEGSVLRAVFLALSSGILECV
jgi:serine/threonine protein kinase